MNRASFQDKAHARERDERAVAALVQLLMDSGFKPSHIEATLRNTTAPANLDRLSDVYTAACSQNPARRQRAA